MFVFSNEQYLFDRILFGLGKAIKFAFILLLYSPLWFTAYLVCSIFLDTSSSIWLWLVSIILGSLILHYLLFLVKGFIATLKSNGNWLWLPILILSVSFTSILPVWLMFPAIYDLMNFLSIPEAKTLTWMIAGTLSLIMYLKYH